MKSDADGDPGKAIHASYFCIYALTYLGSALTGITCFLQVGLTFPLLLYVSGALAIKTLAMMVLGMLAPRLIFRWDLRRTLVFAQFSGIVSLCIIYVGFDRQNFVLAMAGMILAGIPTMLLNIISTSVFKIQADKPEHFRRLQGTASSIGGLCFLSAALLAPIVLHKLGLRWVLLFDASTYLVGGLYLASRSGRWIVNLNDKASLRAPPDLPLRVRPPEGVESTRERPFVDSRENDAAPVRTLMADGPAVWRSAAAVQFLLLATTAYLLVGLLPLVASSQETLWGQALAAAGLHSGSLWVLEALSAMLGGLVYARLSHRPALGAVLNAPIPPGMFLLPLFFIQDAAGLTAFLLFLTALFTQLRFMRIRDNFLLVSRSDLDTVRASALASVVGNGLMFVSPILVAPFVMRTASPLISAGALGGALAVLYLLSSVHSMRQSRKPLLA